MKHYLCILLFFFCVHPIFSQENGVKNDYWNVGLKIMPFRLPPPPIGYKPELIDLDGDGDPDILKSVTSNGIPVMWIDDNDNMTWDDPEGDTAGDCLLIDRNKDGFYGGLGDLIIKWVDTNNDGKADMQVVIEYPAEQTDKVWPYGHYMWVLDTDNDNIFNYIDWNTFSIKAWEKIGLDNILTDYSGHTAFLKIHTSTDKMKDLRLNWENPFLFYDMDGDGLTEMAIRMVDSPGGRETVSKKNTYDNMQLKGTIDWVSIAIDMDNDNSTEKHFDFDMTLHFSGEGFNYMDQVHSFPAMRGLPETDAFFIDPRWRHLTELIYPDHDAAWDLIFKRGKWDTVWFVYDEDDDCNRWERVELLQPLDPFIIGTGKGGIDNNNQADAAGDRGEWDLDNSGKGNLYVSKFDGRIHLYGAEWGCWRIDQQAAAYQGTDRNWLKREPTAFSTVKYSDRNNNGFFDYIEYDLDGDSVFEYTIDLLALGIDDSCEIIPTAELKYADFVKLMEKVSENMWKNAGMAMKVMKKYNRNLSWYAKLMETSSVREKYNNGYWLQFYIYKDLENYFLRTKQLKLLDTLHIAYFSAQWEKLM
jgi:hypothetical protein